MMMDRLSHGRKFYAFKDDPIFLKGIPFRIIMIFDCKEDRDAFVNADSDALFMTSKEALHEIKVYLKAMHWNDGLSHKNYVMYDWLYDYRNMMHSYFFEVYTPKSADYWHRRWLREYRKEEKRTKGAKNVPC